MKRKYWLNILCYFGTFSFLVLSCQQEDEGYRDIRNYYFPLKRLKEGVVYEFRSVNSPQMAPAFWYFRSVVQDGKKVLTSTYYEQDLLPMQFMQEEMVTNGMLLDNMYIYGPGNAADGRQKKSVATIVAGNTFPFQVRDSGGVFVYHVQWKDPADSLIAHAVIKNRYFVGDTVIVLEGRKYPAIKFALKESYEMDNYGVFETFYTGEEVYARGIGLVYYKKNINPGMTLEFQLARRYPMEVLEQYFRRRYGE
jgi:hypothetical protein